MKIIKKEKLTECFTRYDLTVSKNSNFVAEDIVVHNSNNRFCYSKEEDKFYNGSRNNWYGDDSMFAIAKKKYPGIEEFCRKYPDYVLYGEIFGNQGGVYRYGLPSGNYDFRAFDIRDKDFQFITYEKFKEICKLYSIPMVPEIYIGNYKDLEFLKQFAEGNSEIAPNVPKEGCVVKSYVEKRTEHGERMVFKIIGSGYKG